MPPILPPLLDPPPQRLRYLPHRLIHRRHHHRVPLPHRVYRAQRRELPGLQPDHLPAELLGGPGLDRPLRRGVDAAPGGALERGDGGDLGGEAGHQAHLAGQEGGGVARGGGGEGLLQHGLDAGLLRGQQHLILRRIQCPRHPAHVLQAQPQHAALQPPQQGAPGLGHQHPGRRGLRQRVLQHPHAVARRRPTAQGLVQGKLVHVGHHHVRQLFAPELVGGEEAAGCGPEPLEHVAGVLLPALGPLQGVRASDDLRQTLRRQLAHPAGGEDVLAGQGPHQGGVGGGVGVARKLQDGSSMFSLELLAGEGVTELLRQSPQLPQHHRGTQGPHHVLVRLVQPVLQRLPRRRLHGMPLHLQRPLRLHQHRQLAQAVLLHVVRSVAQDVLSKRDDHRVAGRPGLADVQDLDQVRGWQVGPGLVLLQLAEGTG
mmetsp:Transcript_47719/g.126214  ORF Transcript_47719/g.126214 Transcript_47719/m.126214 type:complete len:428 (+) Transcript_47719:1602-2885(+)